MFLYRDHRGMLSKSMDTAQEFKSRDDLIDYLQNSLDEYGEDRFDCSKATIEPYGFDDRIGWGTYIVHLEGYGVFGFTNGKVGT